jgi:DNA-binding protein HU-beta
MGEVNKTQLINQVARRAKISNYAARTIVNACFYAIRNNTKSRTGVTIAGFGRFYCGETAGRRVYNSRTGRTVWKKGRRTICFTPTTGW